MFAWITRHHLIHHNVKNPRDFQAPHYHPTLAMALNTVCAEGKGPLGIRLSSNHLQWASPALVVTVFRPGVAPLPWAVLEG